MGARFNLTFTPGSRVNIHLDVNGETEVHRGFFIVMDETGLMVKNQKDEYLFFPRERIVMLAKEPTR